MISEYISLLISPHNWSGPGDFEKEYGGLSGCAKNSVNGGGMAHIIVSDDTILPVQLAFSKAEGIEISFCDFNSLAAIDRAVKKNTVLAYCEYPSAKGFRTYDFEKISGFLNYFKIKLACGLYFGEPYCCGYDGKNGAKADGIDDHFVKISRNAANAREIHEILSRKDIFSGLDITRVDSSKYADYKNNRKISKINGCYLKIGGGDKIALKAAFDSLCAALDGSGFIKGKLSCAISDYYRLARDYDNCSVYSVSSETALEKSRASTKDENGSYIEGIIIKAGTNASIIEKLSKI